MAFQVSSYACPVAHLDADGAIAPMLGNMTMVIWSKSTTFLKNALVITALT